MSIIFRLSVSLSFDHFAISSKERPQLLQEAFLSSTEQLLVHGDIATPIFLILSLLIMFG